MTEIDAALFYDTAVQNGGVSAARAKAIDAAVANLPAGADDRARLTAIAEALTTGVRPKYVDDVRDRRMAIARGTGTVHGAAYKIDGWALDLLPITTADLA